MKECVSVPGKEHVRQLSYSRLPKRIIVANVVAVALITVGSLAPIYARAIKPDLRATALPYPR